MERLAGRNEIIWSIYWYFILRESIPCKTKLYTKKCRDLLIKPSISSLLA